MIRLAILLVWCAGAVLAQTQVSLVGTEIRETGGGLELTFTLDGITPYRVFTLNDPERLMLDLENVDPEAVETSVFGETDLITAARTGPLRPGWSRLILDLAAPLALDQAGMVRDRDAVVLTLTLATVTAEEFAARSGAPPDPGWNAATGFDPLEVRRLADSTDFVVMIDPAHGGIDHGITAGGIKEADLTLIMAQELAVRLNRQDGVSAVLTRQADTFVHLSARRDLAAQVGADLLLVFHAEARGDQGSRVASYGDDAAGLDGHEMDDGPRAAEDAVSTILGDLARAAALPEGDRIADALVAGFVRAGVPVSAKPRLAADLPMLRDIGVPAVAILLGDLESPEDRAFLVSADGRNRITATIAETLELLAR